jgi:hypothetical protein
MEPSPKTHEEVGRLCAAWAYLETVSEHTLWGVLETDQRWGEIISARLDLQSFWKLILEQAESKLEPDDFRELREINKSIIVVSRHRNIIVHGRIHASVTLGEQPLPAYHSLGPDAGGGEVLRVPCWTIFKGPDARRSFPISTEAAEVVRTNVQILARKVEDFNKRYGHFEGRMPDPVVVTDWPPSLLE